MRTPRASERAEGLQAPVDLREETHCVHYSGAALGGTEQRVRIAFGGTEVDERSVKQSGLSNSSGQTGAGSTSHGPNHNADRLGDAARQSALQQSVAQSFRSVRGSPRNLQETSPAGARTNAGTLTSAGQTSAVTAGRQGSVTTDSEEGGGTLVERNRCRWKSIGNSDAQPRMHDAGDHSRRGANDWARTTRETACPCDSEHMTRLMTTSTCCRHSWAGGATESSTTRTGDEGLNDQERHIRR